MGMIVYWLRRFSAPTLFLTGLVMILLGSVLFSGLIISSISETSIRKNNEQLEKIIAQAPKTAEQVRQSDFLSLAGKRAVSTLVVEGKLLFAYALWRILGLMLWGIALVKWRGLEARWSARAYVRCMVVGFSVGLLLTALDTLILQVHRFSPIHRELSFFTAAYFGSIFLALGYFGLVMLMVQKNWLRVLQDRLAAVGRMAFTNYLMHTLICTFIFNGWGLGQFGLWPRSELFVLVLSIWLLQLVVSPLWLTYFRFGPFEWLWRSLTYRRSQPMIRRSAGGEA
jgi:uncharacterized protein